MESPSLALEGTATCLLLTQHFPSFQPDETQKIEGLGLVDAQSMAVVQPEPGAHPVPLYAYSIKDQSNGKVRPSPRVMGSQASVGPVTCLGLY